MYEVLVRCTNCDCRDEIKIERGTPISEVDCSNCGCEMLEKDVPVQVEFDDED